MDCLADRVRPAAGLLRDEEETGQAASAQKGLKRILLDIDKAIQIIRETEEEAEVIPNLMIGFGIDQVQAEYVAEIKLRNINKEYILKRVKETDALRTRSPTWRTFPELPRRIQKILMDRADGGGQEIRRAPPHPPLWPAARRPTRGRRGWGGGPHPPWSLSGEGVLQEDHPRLSANGGGPEIQGRGDGLSQTFETTNGAEIMFFTDRCQVYKTRLSEFEDTKASALGDYLPAKLSMDSGENVIYAVLPGPDYAGGPAVLLCKRQGGPGGPDRLQDHLQPPQADGGLLPTKAPLACIRRLDTDCELAVYSTEPGR